ncbi:MAG: hypothetical protein ACQEUT_01680 [Bacillota bacterium]
MKKIQEMPKTIKKTVRYIYQDAPLEKLEEIQRVIDKAFQTRIQESNNN